MSKQLEGKRIGFIGCGAMARALAGGLASSGIPTGQMQGADLSESQRQGFESELGIATSESNSDLMTNADIVVLCVKPDVVNSVLAQLGPLPESNRPLWISIAAGVRLASLEKCLPAEARIVRGMPNTPALVGQAATALCANRSATPADMSAADALFSAVGFTWLAEEEGHLDAVTGLSGSGPAYVFLFLEALEAAGVSQGLPRSAAKQLASQTVLGAASLAHQDGRDPALLRAQVTSPGGTTLAGLEQLESAGMRDAIHSAVAAATRRSRELSGDD